MQQVLGEIRKLILKLELHPRAEKGDTLKQTLDIGIGVGGVFEPQASGDVLVFLAKLPRGLPKIGQFFVVGAQQAGVQTPYSRRVTAAVSSSTSVLNSTGIACTAVVTSPRMR